MMIQEVSAQTPVYDRRSYSAAVNVAFSSSLALKTSEGDLVNISLANEQSLEKSRSQTQTAGGDVVSELSSVAVAASRYSIAVQGDLNEDELNAIQRLVQEIGPVAQRFFDQGEFDANGAIQALSGSLGVIGEVELALERVITATFSAQSVSSRKPVDTVNLANADPPSGEDPFSAANIRNPSELIFASLESEFESQAAKLPKAASILRSLSDLMLFLREQLGPFLNPLEHTGTPELEPVPQNVGIASSGNEKTQ